MRIKTLSALLLVVGCADSEVAKTAITDQEVLGDNGVSLNGVSLNGTDFVGAEFAVALSNGLPASLRIDSMSTLTDANADVYTYKISIAADGGWQSLCDGGDAVAIPGSWNPANGAWSDGNFSFACRGSSVAKCLELGYKTWYGFGDHQRACVRMLRADYCGDGVSHTVNGTQINVYDDAGVQADTESWQIDGEWSPDGALCFNHYRGTSLPTCSQKQSTSCGTFANGALLVNERE